VGPTTGQDTVKSLPSASLRCFDVSPLVEMNHWVTIFSPCNFNIVFISKATNTLFSDFYHVFFYNKRLIMSVIDNSIITAIIITTAFLK
jgi:hypothetical protein